MPAREMTEEQIMADILNKLVNKGAYGKYDIPIDQMKSWLHHKIKKNGKAVTKAIDNLSRIGLIIKSARNTIFANPHWLNEIEAFIKKNLVD